MNFRDKAHLKLVEAAIQRYWSLKTNKHKHTFMGINSTDVISQQLNQVEEKVMVEGKDVDCSQLVTSSQHVLGIESVISEELNVESKVC